MPTIRSAFSVSADGWTTSGGASLAHDAANGEISGTDNTGGVVWFFEAPTKFEGDLSAYYGGTFSFELRRTEGTTFDDVDLRIAGSNGQVLVLDLPPSATTWTTFNATLAAGAGWRLGTLDGVLATEAQIRAVLGSVSALQIRGEHISGADTEYLDNVRLATAGVLDTSTATAILSDFNRNAEGWATVGDASASGHVATGGQSGGYFRVTDAGLGDIVSYSAPEAYLGDKSAFYGGILTYSLKSTAGTSFDAYDIVLSGGGLTLMLDAGPGPGTDWTEYAVLLDVEAGWRVGSLNGPTATGVQIQQVLGALEEFLIRAEFTGELDAGGLDNVALTAPGAAEQAWELYASTDETELQGVFGTFGGALAAATAGDTIVWGVPLNSENDLGATTITVNNLTVRAALGLDAAFTLGAGAVGFALDGLTTADVTGNALGNSIVGGGGSNVLNGAGGNDSLVGGAGDDVLIGGVGIDQMDGGFGRDTVDYSASAQAVTVVLQGATARKVAFAGTLTNETVRNIENVVGGSAGDRITGDALANRLEGRGGADRLVGGAAGDTLLGGVGNDVLTGGAGKDELWGEAGADVYDYNFISESRVGQATRDVIRTWDTADTLDFRDLDGNATQAGNQDFLFIGQGAANNTVGQGQVKFYHLGGNTYVVANQTADTTADFEIFIAGVHALTAADFLGVFIPA